MREKRFKIHNPRFKIQKGFSMVETLLYLGIFSMILVTLFQLLTSILDLQLESSSTSSVDQDGLYLLNRLTYDIQRAASITTPVSGQTSSTLVLVIGSSNMTYSSSSGNLVLTNSGLGTTDQLSSTNTGISNLSFKTASDSANKNYYSITAAFTLVSKDIKRGGAKVKNFKTTIGTRFP